MRQVQGDQEQVNLHVARTCIKKKKLQNVNAVDESGSASGQNVYDLFTLGIYSVRALSVQKGEGFCRDQIIRN